MVQKLINEGQIRSVKIGSRRLIVDTPAEFLQRQIQDNRDADYEAWRDYWARLHADKGRPDSSEAVRLFRGLVDFLCDGQDEMIDTLLHWIGFEADA
ncbi:MAG: hypothetical protein ACPG40_08705 [Alphaproteobacteria bacterium]